MKGGYKPGGGRPKGSRTIVEEAGEAKPKAPSKAERPPKDPVLMPWPHDADRQVTPLEYMLHVINDPTSSVDRRDRIAMAAAPFVHERVADTIVGKKQKLQAEATKAGEGSDWGDDLRSEEIRPN